MKSFASDNYSGVHPKILGAIIDANLDHEIAYGNDSYTQQTNDLFNQLFGQTTVLYAFNGTGANVVCLKCCVLPFQAIVCSEYAHIQVDECGAPTQSIGASILTIPSKNGKISPADILPTLGKIGNVHNVQPKVISISQTTELGTVYSVDELKEICDFAHSHDMYVHLDGARISNAVATLGVSLKEATVDCGIDIMSFGGTKNGLLMGEAVLIFNKELVKNAPYFHKQSAQLFSKNRFIAAQFRALLTDNLWLEMALHANKMASLLASCLENIENVKITRPVDANAVFAILPFEAIEKLQAVFPFYVWDETSNEVRWMCSFDTTADEINEFVSALKAIVK